MPDNPGADGPSAERLLDRLRDFASTLDPEERQLLAALLAPGIDAAWGEPDEVTGFTVTWSPDHLPDQLSAAIRGRSLRVEGW